MVSKADGFSVSQFYGKIRRKTRKHREPAIREMLRQMRSRLPSDFPHRILGPTYCWKIFYRQNDAFRWAGQIAKDLLVFAFESCDGNPVVATGRRRYLVTSLDVFWHYYSQLNPSQRHHYEIIPEGCPCHLYFDLEFMIEFNPGHNGDKMVELLIKYVCMWLEIEFSIHCDRTVVLDLDASTGNKFSRHLIFHVPGAVFENCISTGNFVRHIFGVLLKFIKLKSEDLNPKILECESCKIYSHDAGLSQTSTNDQLVPKEYFQFDDIEDENELVAIAQTCEEAYSSGKNDVRSVAQENGTNDDVCALTRGNKNTDESFGDMDSSHDQIMRICEQFSLDDLKTLQVLNRDGVKTLFCDLGVYTKNRNFRLYLSSKLNKNNPLLISSWNQFKPRRTTDKISDEQAMFNESLVSYRWSTSDMRVLAFDSRDSSENHHVTSPSTDTCNKSGSRITQNEDSLEGLGCSSPYPEIDGFIESVASSHGCQGRVRHWAYFRSSNTILYDIIGCRWCDRVGREHRSNNIMFVVDLRIGVFYQKCYDPDCQAAQYRSNGKEIPNHLLPSSFFDVKFDVDYGDIDDSNDVDDSILLAAVENVELGLAQGEKQQNVEIIYERGVVSDDDDDDAMVAASEEVEMYLH